MAWICWGLIQQRREPPMATSRALVMVPLWSRNFCRMAWGQCWGQWDWDCWHQGPQVPPPSPTRPALTSVWFSRATSEASRAMTVSLDVMFHWRISTREYR